MSEFLSAGVFIEEQASDLQTIQAVSTSNGAFVGFTPQGVTDLATLCTSYPDAVRKFGGLTRKGVLGYMLAAFFQNGGNRAYVVRVAPSDAVKAQAKIRSQTTDQQIETGATGTAAFTKTGAASVLKDNGGITPLAPSSIGVRFRSPGPGVSTQAARARNGSTILVVVSGTAYYEGRVDPKATLLFTGADADGGVYYRSVADNGTDVQVTHVNAGASQSLAVSVSGNRITVTLATDSSALVTSTATEVAAAIAASTPASALVTASPTGTGGSLALAHEVTNLRGVPALDAALDAIVPGTVVLHWQAGGSGKSISFSGLTTTPTQTATNVAGSTATIDLRTGRFVLVTAPSETPGGPDAGAMVSLDYTPGTATRTLVDDGAGALGPTTILTAPGAIGYDDGSYSFTCRAPTAAGASIGGGTNGTVNVSVDLAGPLGNEYAIQVFLPSGTHPLSAQLIGTNILVNLAVTSGTPTSSANTATLIAAAITALPGVTATASGSGATEIVAAEGPHAFSGGQDDYRPHNLARVLATYAIYAWSLTVTGGGLWGNRLQVVVAGDPTTYVPGTASFTQYTVSLQLADPDSGIYAEVEGYDELIFTDPTNAQFWADVVNELSDYTTVAEPGGNEAPGQLSGIARSVVIGGGDESTGGQTFSSIALPNGPLAGRSITISYTDVTGVARTITDNGFGVLTGSVDASYATVVGSLSPNRVDMTTGALNFKTQYAIRRGTLVTATYRSAPAEAAHTEKFGDATAGYTAGADGTFDATHYGRNQISEPTGLQPVAKGLYALDRVDEIMQVTVPDFAGDTTVSGDLIDYAEGRASSNASGGDRFVILTTPKGSSAQEAGDWVQNQLGRKSKYAAVYWPWVRIRDPLADNRLTTIAPLGHIAGIYARTDQTRNVGKAPAGTVDGQLSYVAELERAPTQGERDYVYPRNINPLRQDAQVGRCVWGSRTLAALSSWRQVNAVRLFMFAEKSVFNSTHWTVFENNGPALWARIKLQLEGFLSGLFTDGYFAGATRAEAYSIIVDSTNNPQSVIDAGQVVVDVALAPNKPAEFVRFRFAQRSLAA